MVDLFVAFHWSPDITDPMPLNELMYWRIEAGKRFEKTK